MNETVGLYQNKAKGHSYWVLKWRGTDGKQHGQTVGRVDKISPRQAEKLRVKKLNELAIKPGRRNVSGSPRLEDYLAAYLQNRKCELAPGTLELHDQSARYLLGFFGKNRRLDTIQRPDTRAFKTALANGDLRHVNKRKTEIMAAGTVSQNIRNARTIFQTAVDDDLLQFNPFDKLAGELPPVKDWHYVTWEEFDKLVDAARPSWKLMFSLCRRAGLRRNEALMLRWDKIDWDRSRLTVIANDEWRPKDKDSRIVPIGPELYEILLSAFDNAEEGAQLVIPAKSINPRNISRDFDVLCKRAAVGRYEKPTHSMRKSCLTDWAAKFPAHVVKEWAGHSSFEITDEFYLKVSEGDYEAAAGRTPGECSQLCSQPAKKDEKSADEEKEAVSQVVEIPGDMAKAGDEIRTHDVQLGKTPIGLQVLVEQALKVSF